MGFFGSLWNGIQNTTQEMQNLKNQYQSYDDYRLVRIAKTGSFTEKAVAMSVLKERHGQERAKEMIMNG